MPLPTIADTYRCALETAGPGGQYAYNVFHVRAVGGTPAAVRADVAATVKNSNSPYRFLMSNAAHLSALFVTPLFSDLATSVEPLGTDAVGGASGEALISQNGLLSLRSALRGPRGRGRQYLSFISEGVAENGFIKGDSLALANAALPTWDALFAADSIEYGVASYAHSEFVPITNMFIESPMATQRRRQDRLRATS